MILLIDNYDSFTYNLYQYLGEIGEEVQVIRNDKITLQEIELMAPTRIVLSPGPGRPENAGICLDVIKHFKNTIPILGICLGHQAIGEAFGGKIIHAPDIFHGKISKVYHNSKGLFQALPKVIDAGRYHSLIVDKETLPDCLEITAWTEDKIIMGFKHKDYAIEGIQFHPESILTECGKQMLKTFVTQKAS